MRKVHQRQAHDWILPDQRCSRHYTHRAQAIVDKDTMIMPFTTNTGYISMLRHLGPETVYLQASLAGNGGDYVTQVKSWVDQIVLVVGDDSGHGGLADSEDEHGTSADKWWLDDPRIGLGKGGRRC